MSFRNAVQLTPATLHGIPLPEPDESGSKEERGRILVVGGERENPGAMVLSGTAALRAGGGKLQLATAHSIAVALGIAIPEARVFGMAETKQGAIDPATGDEIVRLASGTDAFVLGPGMLDEASATAITRAVLAGVDGPAVALDAGAFPYLAGNPDALLRLEGRVVITPHAGEMAMLLGMEKSVIERDPLSTARRAARDLGAVVALKGPETFIAGPDGGAYRYTSGGVGLATSGSGDVLAGIVGGLLARGADPLTAAAWAVYLHGEAGNALAAASGRIGFLARELAAEVPPLMERLSGERRNVGFRVDAA
ncbi:MAG TPA: NAD(P)H-hydrate dehydratase [Longimicrobium sp.]|nr:NAD(P)H-hydrate dehydratase [Longimicrobium sp.]